MIPTDEDVHFYRQHGWWVSPPCIDDRRLDELTRGIERYYAGERDFRLTTVAGDPWSEETGEGVRRGNFLSLLMAEFRAFITDPLLPAMAARLAGTPEIRLFHDQVWYKEPGVTGHATEIGWHTDKTFWRSCSSSEMLTAWIPLQDCTVEMGPLAVIDASHRWAGTESGAFDRRRLPALSGDVSPHDDDVAPVVFAVQRGRVVFHHCRTVHGSWANVAQTPRIALCVHYQDGANTYRPDPQSRGKPLTFINDLLCTRTAQGVPDYGDPKVCLRLWPPT